MTLFPLESMFSKKAFFRFSCWFCLMVTVFGVCPTPRIPDEGFLLTCGTVTGAVCQLRCRSGEKVKWAKCLENGTWDGDSINCSESKDACKPNLKAPTNGQIVGECSANMGSVCNFKCNQDYRLIGSAQVYCFGTWSSSEPTCVKELNNDSTTRTGKCPALQSPINGYNQGTCYNGAPVNSICYFGCISGYTLYGSISTICLSSGQWSSAVPFCHKTATSQVPNLPPGPSSTPGPPKTSPSSSIKTTSKPSSSCKSVQDTENGQLKGACSPGVTGQTCSLVCSNGYYPKGTRSISCLQSGQWSGKLGYCNRVPYYLVRTWSW